jgi:uracil-DNA glycosylase
MKPCEELRCDRAGCAGVRPECFALPDRDFDPDEVSVVLISEAAPAAVEDNYYAGGSSLFERTTLLAFQDAGANVACFDDVVALGVYLTTAVKCGKTGYAIATPTIEECSRILERELALFPKAKAWLLMGDVAIKAVNLMAARNGLRRAVPSGPTWRIRRGEHWFGGRRVFPSYLQAGPSFFIEKTKRAMIAEDIAAALAFAR